MNIIPKETEKVAVLVKVGHGLAQRLEADERLKDLAGTVREAAARLEEAADKAREARRAAWLCHDLHAREDGKVLGTIRMAELDARMASEGHRDAAGYKALFPEGLGTLNGGKAAARDERRAALARALAATTGLEARGKALAEAIAAAETTGAAHREARLRARVAAQAASVARAAFQTAWRVTYAAVVARLGDPRAARAVFPDLGKVAGAPAPQPGAASAA